MTTSIDISQYKLVYEVTALPIIIFAEMTNANEPLYFSSPIEISAELQHFPIDLRITLYSPEGRYIEMTYKTVHSRTLTSQINTLPLKMINNLLKNQSNAVR